MSGKTNHRLRLSGKSFLEDLIVKAWTRIKEMDFSFEISSIVQADHIITFIVLQSNLMCVCVFLRGPRCVARFDFEGEQGDELSFFEDDVIQLKEYIGEEWARGEVNGHVGIFPLNFVEVIEDLPSVPVQKSAPNKIALPGKSLKTHFIWLPNTAHSTDSFEMAVKSRLKSQIK